MFKGYSDNKVVTSFSAPEFQQTPFKAYTRKLRPSRHSVAGLLRVAKMQEQSDVNQKELEGQLQTIAGAQRLAEIQEYQDQDQKELQG